MKAPASGACHRALPPPERQRGVSARAELPPRASAGISASTASYIAAHYRHTSLGGLTVPIAVRRAGATIAVVRPIGKSFSRSGTHGVFYFPADVDAIVYLDRSNSGYRSVYVRYLAGDAGFCDALWRCAHLLWAVRGLSPRDVIAALPSCR